MTLPIALGCIGIFASASLTIAVTVRRYWQSIQRAIADHEAMRESDIVEAQVTYCEFVRVGQ